MLSELMAVVTAGRSEPLVDIALREAGPEAQAAFRDVREAMASVALVEPPCTPSPQLRGRILRSLAMAVQPSRRAVLVVDMQNDHLLPGRPLEVPRASEIVPALV